MARAREVERDRRSARRAVLKNVARAEAISRRSRLVRTLGTVSRLLSDEGFVQAAAAHGVCYAPKKLFARNEMSESLSEQDLSDEQYPGAVLDFVAAWKFLFPMFSHPDMAEYFRTDWPGFVDDLKDTFIALVMQGPFLDERQTSLNSGAFK